MRDEGKSAFRVILPPMKLGRTPFPRERGVNCELAPQMWSGRATEEFTRQTQNDGVTSRCIEVCVDGAHTIMRAKTICVASARRAPLVDTSCRAVIPSPEEVKITCSFTSSAFAACVQSCLAGLEDTLSPHAYGPFFCRQQFARCWHSCCASLQPR